jgi:1-acyl-sn-glycerol-3-phosphate acyltransferase
MSQPGDIERPRLEYSPEHYDLWSDRAEVWLPRIGGYDYEVQDELETDGAAILSPKHTGMMDVPLVGTVVRAVYGRHMRAPAKKELYEVPIFGEGTRVRSQEVGRIKKGLAYLAIKHKAPVQAVGVAGTRHWLGRKFVVLGDVITPDLDKVDPEDRKSAIKYASVLTKDIHRAMQEANDRAYTQRDRMHVYIPFFRTTKPDKK